MQRVPDSVPTKVTWSKPLPANTPGRRPPSLPTPGRTVVILQAARSHNSWRTAGISFASLAAPTAAGFADPFLGQIVVAVEMAIALMVVGAALFGSQTQSDRAFRLLRWLRNRSEPPTRPDCEGLTGQLPAVVNAAQLTVFPRPRRSGDRRAPGPERRQSPDRTQASSRIQSRGNRRRSSRVPSATG